MQKLDGRHAVAGDKVRIMNGPRTPKYLHPFLASPEDSVGVVELVELGSNFRNPQLFVKMHRAVPGKAGKVHGQWQWIRATNVEVIA